jgi:hypothetical protein
MRLQQAAAPVVMKCRLAIIVIASVGAGRSWQGHDGNVPIPALAEKYYYCASG